MHLVLVNLLAGLAAASGLSCQLTRPPASAGETQAHGIIIYVYPRNPDIGPRYTGCQQRWFSDDGHFRVLSVTRYSNGAAVEYDDVNIDGKVAYQCHYSHGHLLQRNDDRCPGFGDIAIKSYHAGCYSKQKLNSSDFYTSVPAGCKLK